MRAAKVTPRSVLEGLDAAWGPPVGFDLKNRAMLRYRLHADVSGAR